ncbi:MAG TPA: FIST N-terminal domain-containing protein [Candidatus Saccharimonadales bacterium]|nr:FIST N-terminal domain-containing protein [Candidatus Saccharimonadales bacterium]
MTNEFSVAGHWHSDFEETNLAAWAQSLRAQLTASEVSLGLVFIHPRFFNKAKQILEIIQLHARVPLLAGCSSTGLIAGAEEAEDEAGISLALYYLPESGLKAYRFTQDNLDEATGPGYWHMETGLGIEQTNGWLIFADPFTLDAEKWLQSWDEAYKPLPILGGLASGNHSAQQTQIYLDGNVYEEGGVGISFGGNILLEGVISQGCTPIGQPWTITKSERNFIHEIGNQPAYQVLAETVSQLSPEEQQKARGNIFIGLVVNEYLEDFQRGDFLIRNLIGADPKTGVLAVGALPRTGQTIQFQRRDAQTGTEDVIALLKSTHKRLSGKTVYGGCLCSCNGRGRRLFGKPNHDASHVQAQFGPIGLAGFFCNGEIGPIGEKSFLHGYTASLALFVQK